MRTATSTNTLMDRCQQQQQQQPPHLESFLLVCNQHRAKQRLEILLLQGKSLLKALLSSEQATQNGRQPHVANKSLVICIAHLHTTRMLL